jgi:oxygen-independent coproporphyrinogen-3 oxidase
MGSIPAIAFDAELIRRFDRPGPRYTSYPTADRFVDSFDDAAYRSWVTRRDVGGIERPLSLYVHLPFCRDVCYYCACNRIVTRDRVKAAVYLDYLAREIAMQAELFREGARVEQMHWGGGTPTYYDTDQLQALFQRIAGHFELAPDGEYSIEIDPRTVDADAVARLREIGFNRVSFGVQDFDPAVQVAVHRLQGAERTLEVMDAARRAGYQSINIDLIYGLPRQTPESFGATLGRVLDLRPHRLALYNYAHLPHLFKPQRRINDGDLPSPETRLKLLGLAIEKLGAAGYVYIGMDHFALPDDALAAAQRRGTLKRGFQGYSVSAECDLVGLGLSAIGAIGPTYSQNHRTLEEYYDRLDAGRLPVMRGIELNPDDLARRAVIQALMCQFALAKESVEVAYLIDFDRAFATELAQLREFERLGLIADRDGWLVVSPRGRLVIRNICMVFDRYLRHDRDVRRYSRVI